MGWVQELHTDLNCGIKICVDDGSNGPGEFKFGRLGLSPEVDGASVWFGRRWGKGIDSLLSVGGLWEEIALSIVGELVAGVAGVAIKPILIVGTIVDINDAVTSIKVGANSAV